MKEVFERPKEKKVSIKNIFKLLFLSILTIAVINNTYQYNSIRIAESKKKVIIIDYSEYIPTDIMQANVVISTSEGHGSGSIIKVTKDSTFILTAAHIVTKEEFVTNENNDTFLERIVHKDIKIILPNKNKMKALVIKFDNPLDLAVLKVYRKLDIAPVKIAKTEPGLGETIWAISNPGSTYNLINKGIYSSKNENTGVVSVGGFFGSSGGMCLNKKGEQIGIIKTILFAQINNLIPSITIYNGITRTNDLNEFLKDVL